MRRNETWTEQLERWKSWPVRTCRTSHECFLCEEEITLGDIYHDGGYGNRAHVGCVAQRAAAMRIGKSDTPWHDDDCKCSMGLCHPAKPSGKGE